MKPLKLYNIDDDTPLVPEIIADMVTTSRRKANILCARARQQWRDSAEFRQAFRRRDMRDVLKEHFRRWIDEMDSSASFDFEVNLDDPEELQSFLDDFEPARGRQLANRLGFRGKGSVKAADGLMNYSCNKRAAITCRERGDIQEAMKYEVICDRVYDEDIRPLINAW